MWGASKTRWMDGWFGVERLAFSVKCKTPTLNAQRSTFNAQRSTFNA
jgi:hypothetical protein